MKKKHMTRGRKTKVWIASLVGALLIGIWGGCGSEAESEAVDRSMPVTEEMAEDITEAPEDILEGEEQELIAEVLPETEEETEVTKEAMPEPTATPTPEPTATPTPEPTATPEPMVEKTTPTGTDYILNTNTKKFHYPSCSSVEQMKEKNKAYFTGTREECIGMGYDPCGRCKP